MSKILHSILCGTALLLSACSDSSPKQGASPAGAPAISNRLHVPPEVISNLGITFAEVKLGTVGEWRELPGRLEVPEERRYVVRAAARSRVKTLVPLWGVVSKGQLLSELTSAQLLAQQHSLITAYTVLESTRREKQENPQTQLRLAQNQRAFRQELNAFSVLTGLSTDELLAEQNGIPQWQRVSALSIHSQDEGNVVEVATAVGELVEEGAKLATVYNLSTLLFRGVLPEVYLAQLKPQTRIRIRPAGHAQEIESTLERILPVANQDSRSIVLEARVENRQLKLPHGLSATAQVLMAGAENEEAVIPADCLVQDGLEMIVFKKDPEKPAYVVRTPIETGARSGQLVEALSGLMEGDQVVCNGIHQLKLTGLGKAPQGGHFHADGTWHEGDK